MRTTTRKRPHCQWEGTSSRTPCFPQSRKVPIRKELYSHQLASTYYLHVVKWNWQKEAAEAGGGKPGKVPSPEAVFNHMGPSEGRNQILVRVAAVEEKETLNVPTT